MNRLTKSFHKRFRLSSKASAQASDSKAEKVKITVIDYDEKQLKEREVQIAEECFSFKGA